MIKEFLLYIGYELIDSKVELDSRFDDYCITDYPKSYPVYVKCFNVDHDYEHPEFSSYEFEFVYPSEIDQFNKEKK